MKLIYNANIWGGNIPLNVLEAAYAYQCHTRIELEGGVEGEMLLFYVYITHYIFEHVVTFNAYFQEFALQCHHACLLSCIPLQNNLSAHTMYIFSHILICTHSSIPTHPLACSSIIC